MAGVGSAIGASALISHFKPSWVGVIDNRATTIAFLVSVGIGVLFGFFPGAPRQQARRHFGHPPMRPTRPKRHPR